MEMLSCPKCGGWDIEMHEQEYSNLRGDEVNTIQWWECRQCHFKSTYFDKFTDDATLVWNSDVTSYIQRTTKVEALIEKLLELNDILEEKNVFPEILESEIQTLQQNLLSTLQRIEEYEESLR